MKKGPIGWAISIWRFVRDVALRWYHGRVGDLAASVTFWIVVSLPASVLALLAALGPLSDLFGIGFKTQVRDEVTDFLKRVFSDQSGAVTETVSSLFERSSPGLLTLSLALTIWSISRGFAGLIRALEDIYDVEDRRPWYWTRFVAVILGLGSMLISVPLVLMEQMVWGEVITGPALRPLRIIFAVTILVLWASIVFHYGPATRSRWRDDLPGAIVAAVLWWVLSVGFRFYVDWAAGSDALTSAVAAGLFALTWIWLAAQGLLIGGAVNFLFGERLGLSRDRRQWKINDVVQRSTGEIKKIVVPNGREKDSGDRSETLEPAPTGANPIVVPGDVPTDSDSGNGTRNGSSQSPENDADPTRVLDLPVASAD